MKIEQYYFPHAATREQCDRRQQAAQLVRRTALRRPDGAAGTGCLAGHPGPICSSLPADIHRGTRTLPDDMDGSNNTFDFFVYCCLCVL